MNYNTSEYEYSEVLEYILYTVVATPLYSESVVRGD